MGSIILCISLPLKQLGRLLPEIQGKNVLQNSFSQVQEVPVKNKVFPTKQTKLAISDS